MMRVTPTLRLMIVILLGLLLPGATPVAAQDARQATSGLSVTGQGEASAPAETATLQFIVLDSNYGIGLPPWQIGGSPEDREREAVAPIVTALIEEGIAEDAIDVNVGPALAEVGGYMGPAIALIMVMIDSPEPGQLIDLVDAANAAAADERLVMGRTNAVYAVEDCAPLEREAQEMAVADARERANVMAGLASVTIGNVTGIRVLSPETSHGAYGPYGVVIPTNIQTCGQEELLANPAAAYLLPIFVPELAPEVTASVAVEMTFAITGGTDATPAP